MKSMKILIVIGSMVGGGAERVVTYLSAYLSENGYDVIVATFHALGDDFYSLDRRVCRVGFDLSETHKGIKKLTANIKRIIAVRDLIKKENVDIVIGMMTNTSVISILACFGLPVKVIASERNFPGKKKTDWQWTFLRRAVYRYADAHVAQTSKTLEWLMKNCGTKNVLVIPNSVKWPLPSNLPHVNPSLFLEPRQEMILAVGSLTKRYQKGFDTLITAFSAVACEYPNWKLVIVGEKEKGDSQADSQKLLLQIKSAGLEDKVITPGRVGNIGDWYKRADIFVLSSRYEGFPNVLLEAMSSGCACIAFDCDTGPRNIIDNGKNGILVPSQDVDFLAREIKRLICDNELRAKLGSNAVEVKKIFSANKVLGKWLHIIKNLS